VNGRTPLSKPDRPGNSMAEEASLDWQTGRFGAASEIGRRRSLAFVSRSYSHLSIPNGSDLALSYNVLGLSWNDRRKMKDLAGFMGNFPQSDY